MDQDKINILRIFQLDGTPVSCEDYGSGHVNVTFLVVTDTGRRYILQKINHHAFRNVQALSENIAAVTDFLRSKSSDPRSVMSLIRTKDGAPHTRYGEAEMSILQNLLSAGEIPLRVAHNDTKLNNVLLDAKTRKALCVVDLDTVMPGSSLFDFGDAIRYGASTAAEDERDLSKVEMSLERFRVFTRGYVRACPNLTARELELLPLGAKTITLECGMRFLTDHIDGDLYFAVHREGQNLDRARAQFKLAADMEKKWDDMRRIVAEETKA